MIEHIRMEELRKKHPDWIWNRSDTHVILGVPTSHEGFKTVVEPGNSFSPGHRSYGVSTWIDAGGTLHAPEEMPQEQLHWSLKDGHIPVLTSTWRAGNLQVSSRLFVDGDPRTTDIRNYLTVEIENTGPAPADGTFYLAVRSFGAAGGPVRSLEMQGKLLKVNGGGAIAATETPDRFGAVSYEETGNDISVYLRDRVMPDTERADDASTWASGAMAYELRLNPGDRRSFTFVCQAHADNWMVRKSADASLSAADVAQVEESFVSRWIAGSPIKLNVPDRRFREGMLAQLTHMYMATVAAEPRISAISYPLWWLRDGAYVLVALDKGGYRDFVEDAVLGAAHRDAFGGFGAEGDGPANGIWMLSEHYLLTRSRAFLEKAYPHIERKAELIRQMRHTATPMLRHSEIRTYEMMLRPDSDVMCQPASEGLINGRMDHHQPTLWINAYAYMALKRAALCAKELGIEGTWYESEAEDLREALHRKAERIFGDNPRDPNSVLWPTGWAKKDDPLVAAGMERFWNEERCPNGVHVPESMWTYFEAGQAHNYLLLGQRERAWLSIDYFLNEHAAQGLYTYPEGSDDENTSLQWHRTRGWDRIPFITPHCWTAAELFLLLRDCLVREEDGAIVIGSGVPAAWMSEAFSVQGMPTYYGSVGFAYDPADRKLTVSVERMPPGGVAVELPGDVLLEIVEVGG
jgi:hypothetical protein